MFHVEHGKYVRTSRGGLGQAEGAQKAKIMGLASVFVTQDHKLLRVIFPK
jgi:hypothetical protein